MQKSTVIVIVTLISLVFIGIVVGAVFVTLNILNTVHTYGGTGFTPTYQQVDVEIPKDFNKQTLVVFNFKPHGDPDAKLYSIGFARALADRLYCAPTCLTQQMTVGEMSYYFDSLKLDGRKPISDSDAIKCGKRMYICWVVTGDLAFSDGQVKLTTKLTNTHTGKTSAYIADGALSELPSLQTKLTDEIIKGMGLKPTPDQLRAVGKPNFTRADTLSLYGRSFLATDNKERKALRWQALNGDPDASFPMLRLLEFYHYSGFTSPEMQSDKRFMALLDRLDRQYSADSHIMVMKGLLLVQQGRYSDGEAVLRKLVEADPSYVRGHTALEYTARCRGDSDLALSEAQKFVELWPDNAYLHAALARANTAAANTARRGHYQSDMSLTQRNQWQTSCQKTLEEAVTAIKMDRNCEEGWTQLLGVSLQLSRYGDRDTAFNELMRINPKNLSAYKDYAFCFVPQWGGSGSDMEKVFYKAAAVFGKDSSEVYDLRAYTFNNCPNGNRYRELILPMLDVAIKRSKTPNGDLLLSKSEMLLQVRHLDEAQALAEQGVKTWDTPDWRFQLGRCYAMRYEIKHDAQALDKAAEIFKRHVHEVPFAVNGYLQWGWCLSHQGHRAEAKEQFLKGLKLDPTNKVLNEKLKYVQ